MIGSVRQPRRAVLRRLSVAAVCAALSTGGALTGAHASTLKVTGSGEFDDFLARIEQAQILHDEACARVRAEAAKSAADMALWLTPGPDGFRLSGTQGFDAEQTAWAKAALDILRVFEELGGRPAQTAFSLRRVEGRYFVGLEGAGGKSFDDPCAGLAYFLRLLMVEGGAPGDLLKRIGEDASAARFFEAARALARERVLVARGRTVDIQLTAAGGAAGVFQGPDGVTVTDTVVDADGTVRARLTVDESAPVGDHVLYEFDPDDRFHPRAEHPFTILPERGPRSRPARANAGVLPPGARAVGRFLTPDAVWRYRIDVGAASRLNIRSSGMTDVRGALYSADGQLLGVNDDGGAGYNFAFDAELPPGTYFLDVRHCCGGMGEFTVETTAQ